MHSTAADMAKWLLASLASLDHERALLKPETRRLMQSIHMSVPAAWDRTGNPYAARFYGWGFGWRVLDYRGRKLCYHGGSSGAMFAVMPEERLGVVILTNLHWTTLSGMLMYDLLDAWLVGPERDLIYRDLAKDLVAAGLAVVRYDNRGVRCNEMTMPPSPESGQDQDAEFERAKHYLSCCVDPEVRRTVTVQTQMALVAASNNWWKQWFTNATPAIDHLAAYTGYASFHIGEIDSQFSALRQLSLAQSRIDTQRFARAPRLVWHPGRGHALRSGEPAAGPMDEEAKAQLVKEIADVLISGD